MKKKILFSIMAIALVGGLVGSGVFAYFSDTESSTGNTFTAGTLDLEVDSENPWTSTPVNVTCMEPGAAAQPVDITCENVGCLTGDLYMKITNVADTGGVETYACGAPISGDVTSEPECAAEIAAGHRVDDVSTDITLSCEVDGTPVSGIDNTHLSAVPTTWTLIKDNLAGSGSVTLSLGGSLDSGAGNEYQGDKSTFDIELYLAQDNQTPS
jgi:spore coat-associated protein N